MTLNFSTISATLLIAGMVFPALAFADKKPVITYIAENERTTLGDGVDYRIAKKPSAQSSNRSNCKDDDKECLKKGGKHLEISPLYGE